VPDEKTGRQICEERQRQQREANLPGSRTMSLDDLLEDLRKGESIELRVVVKGDVQGSVEAVVGALQTLPQQNVSVKVLRAGVGAITEDDVRLAGSCDGIVVGFNVRVDQMAQAEAQREHVDVKTFQVIYELTDAIERAIKGLLAPVYEEVPLGKAEVRATFRNPRGTVIAGSYVTEGKIVRNAEARVVRNKKVIYAGRIDSLRHIKDDVREMAQGFECGIVMDGFNDFQVGDIVEVFENRRVEPA
jgi:translation initiation factor IF-2